MAEKMVRCPDGHFFDPSKHESCPWCALPVDAGAPQSGTDKTRPVRPGAADAMPVPPPPPLPAGAIPGATRRAGQIPAADKTEPVVGWLVCLDGPNRGCDYRLRAEKNFIGRSPAMDVCIASDDTVSRERHGVVIFDPKKEAFWVLPGDSAGLVYLNGDIVHTPTQLKRDDVIEIGQTKLVLIPFCEGKYSWTAPTAAPA